MTIVCRKSTVALLSLLAVCALWVSSEPVDSRQSPSQTTITVKFVRDGEPASLTPSDFSVRSEGVGCFGMGPQRLVVELSFLWPANVVGTTEPCFRSPPLDLEIIVYSEYGYISKLFTWRGEDTNVEIELPPEPVTYTLIAPFYHDSIPMILPYTVGAVKSDGRFCSGGFPQVVVERTGDGRTWPVFSDPECGQPGSFVEVCAGSSLCVGSVWQPGVVETKALQIPRGVGDSLVVARFLNGTNPIDVTVTDWNYASSTRRCDFSSGGGGSRRVSQLGRFWNPSYYAVGDCGIPGVTIDATFETAEFGTLHGSFTWRGADVAFDVNVSPQPADTVRTGGPP